MTLQTYNTNDLVYTVSPESESPDGMKTWAVLEALLVDEITSQSPAGAVQLLTSFAGLSPRVAPGGKVGFAAIPVRAFPLLRLKDYPVSYDIQAEGYIPLHRTDTFLSASNVNFPNTFNRLDAGTLQLHRLPITISGRVALNTGIEMQAIAGAAITLTGLWRTPPPATMTVPPDPPNLVSLNPGLYADRTQAATTVQGLGFLGLPGPDKQLLQQTVAGRNLVRLSDRKAIAAGDILAIDAQDPERTEYVSINSIAGASTDDQPATITLDLPLRATHRDGAVVHKVQFQNVGPSTNLTADAIPGDVCVFLGGVGSLGGAPFLSLQSAGVPKEYQATSYFTAVSDAQGFFRLPPISRVARCALHSHDGTHTDLDVPSSPDYSQAVSRVDFVYQ